MCLPTQFHLDEKSAIRCRRRAPTFCKACLKKSTSSVLFAKSRLSFMICLRNINSRDAEAEDLSHLIGHASCTATGDIYQVPARVGRCCRRLSFVRLPAVEIPCCNVVLLFVPLCDSLLAK